MRYIGPRRWFEWYLAIWEIFDVGMITGRVYTAAMWSVLLYASETWPSWTEDRRRILVFEHGCIRSIGRIWRVTQNLGVEYCVQPLEQLVSENRLKWLEHIFANAHWMSASLCVVPWDRQFLEDNSKWSVKVQRFCGNMEPITSIGNLSEDTAW